MSILRNFPVVLGQRQIGLLQSVSLNEAQNQVLALIVSCGIRGKRVILPESVEAIGKGFVVVRGVQRSSASMRLRLAVSFAMLPACCVAA